MDSKKWNIFAQKQLLYIGFADISEISEIDI